MITKTTNIESLKKELEDLKLAYNELIEDQKRTEWILTEMPLGEVVMDPKGIILDVKKGFEKFLGYTREEFLGMDFADLLDEEGVEAHKYRYKNFQEAGTARNLDWKMFKKDGSEVVVNLFGLAEYDENGDFYRGRGIIMDITDRVKTYEALYKSEKEKEIILDTIKESVVFFNTEQEIIWANKSAIESLNPLDAKISDSKCFKICNTELSQCENCPVTVSLNSKKIESGEIYINNKNYFATANPVFDSSNKFIGVVTISRDITQQKAIDKQIMEISSNERKKIGHDLHDGLGQKLTGISYLTTALKKELEKENHPESITADKISENITDSLNLMRSILHGLCPVREDPLGLYSALKNLSNSTKELYKINCEFESKDFVIVNNYSISTNLFYIANEAVNNSIKHSKCDTINISLKNNDHLVELEIKDNGKGIKSNNKLNTGMGLQIMKYRASVIDGLFDLESNSSGTKVSCIVTDK